MQVKDNNYRISAGDLLGVMRWVRKHVRPLRLRPGQTVSLYIDLAREVYAAVRVPQLQLSSIPTKLHAGFTDLVKHKQVSVWQYPSCHVETACACDRLDNHFCERRLSFSW